MFPVAYPIAAEAAPTEGPAIFGALQNPWERLQPRLKRHLNGVFLFELVAIEAGARIGAKARIIDSGNEVNDHRFF
ncbi:MAG: hypothetical protein RQ826_13495, partial [Xanthomonadales bacterium]|nr:hypothetical protein [Xanthomonadales bacterium]